MDNPSPQQPPSPPPPHPSTAATTTTTTTNHRNQFVRQLSHLNKHSHKISKPSLTTTTTTTPPPPQQPPQQQPQPQPQPQPPVYNISKSDFRHVVQQLTGSPSHPPQQQQQQQQPPQQPPSSSSRLHRIRPPPLSTRPPSSGFGPLSPLPPLPSCHSSADSPISSYLRFINSDHHLQSGESDPISFGCLPSPKLLLPLSPTVPGVPSPK